MTADFSEGLSTRRIRHHLPNARAGSFQEERMRSVDVVEVDVKRKMLVKLDACAVGRASGWAGANT